MELVDVQGGMQLAAPAAVAWARLRASIPAPFALPVLSSPAGAWRSEEMVVDMWRNPAKYGASQGTAKPKSYGGPGSVHQNGLCIDINNWRSFGDLVVSRGFWRSRHLDQLAAAQGFYPDARYPNEPWHYQHNGTTPAGGNTTPLSDDSEEENMPQYVWTDQDGVGYALIDSNYVDGCVITADPNVATQFSWLAGRDASGAAPIKMTRSAFNAKCAAAVAVWRAHASRSEAAEVDAAEVADAALAKLGDTIATDADLDAMRSDLLAAISAVPAEFGKRLGNG